MAEYIHLFQTEAEFTSAYTNDYHEPWVSYTVETSAITFNKEQLPEGAVDLGLPSGTLWATCNVGASSPEEPGNYYAWGELSGKSDYSPGTYKFGSASPFSKYDTDGKTELELEDDVAHAVMGGNWHMPTSAQCQELIDNTTSAWTTVNGVNGGTFTSKTNGNSIFIPAAGRYNGTTRYDSSSCYLWSTGLSPSWRDSGIALKCNFYIIGMVDNYGRSNGFSVRGVIG